MDTSNIKISQFLDKDGRISKLPIKHSARTAVLSYLAQKFDTDKLYTEKEVNTICDSWHTFHDYFILRRNLVEEKFLMRKIDGSCYWRNNDIQSSDLDVKVKNNGQ
ncbi:MAG: DUF2087 domain-containing protein [Clostridiales bacterium]|nr:DUF2087 domain-containing protein [Clostridiales bacterium]